MTPDPPLGPSTGCKPKHLVYGPVGQRGGGTTIPINFSSGVFLNFDRFGGAAKSGARGQISGLQRLVHWGSGSPRSAVHTLHSLIS